MRTPPVITAVLTAALLTLGACSDGSAESGSGESDSSSPSATATSASPSTSPPDQPSEQPTKPAPSGTTIKITLRSDTVSPNGTRVKVKTGEPVTLKIDADTPGEIHVHSTPEQEIEFDEGRSTKKLTIDRPGIVDVEDHALEQVIVQLEVS